MAIYRTARYEVRPGSLAVAAGVVSRFVASVKDNEPGTRTYLALQDKENPSRFVHLMEFDDAEAEEFHRGTDWVKEFTRGLYPTLEGGISFEELVPVAVDA